ncbi:MAG: hypothetical protein H7222_06705 [Methylotenera sp.]|nr:hypothetical protein [Oligoflexia bacterium]
MSLNHKKSLKVFAVSGLSAVTLLAGLMQSSAKAAVPHSELGNYQVIQSDCQVTGTSDLVRAYRSFELDHEKRILVVDTQTFQSRLMDPRLLECSDEFSVAIAQSPYGRALNTTDSAPFPMADDGIQHSQKPVDGVFLTADLCPAGAHKFEQRFFDALEHLAIDRHQPIPVSLAVTGLWLKGHEAHFQEIRNLEKKGLIQVTWINHTHSHPYRVGVPESRNFVLTPGIHPEAEIQGPEMELLKRGEVPSVFFRFPGLISNETWIRRLKSHSLIPVGSDAWLAKGQKPQSGSIILVHANGNEPEGIDRFLHWLPKSSALGSFLPLTDLF